MHTKLQDHISPATVVSDTGDFVLLKQKNSLSSSYTNFLKLNSENQLKISETSGRLKKLYKNLQKIGESDSMRQNIEEVDFTKDPIFVDCKSDVDINDQLNVDEIQNQFKRTYTKLNDQIERIQHYSKSIKYQTEIGEGSAAGSLDEFNMLVKRLKNVSGGYNRLKYIDQLITKAEAKKKKKDHLRTEEEIILRMLDRDKKLQQVQKCSQSNFLKSSKLDRTTMNFGNPEKFEKFENFKNLKGMRNFEGKPKMKRRGRKTLKGKKTGATTAIDLRVGAEFGKQGRKSEGFAFRG